MSRKVKEQVKYNPSYSSVKRTNKVFKALIGNTNRWVYVLYVILIIFMFIVSTCWAVFDSADFIEDDSTSMFGYMLTFFAITLFTINSCVPNNDTKTQEKARGTVNGCAAVSEVMMHLPITKLDAYRLSFRSYLASMTFPICHILILNIMSVVDERFEAVAVSTGLLNLIFVIFNVFIYLTFFNVLKLSDKTKGHLLHIFFLTFEAVWILSMFKTGKEILELPVFKVFAGIPGIVMLICMCAAVIIIQKKVVEKRAASTAWYQC